MNRRTRALAGILTLSALTFSFAETVFASMCAPMPEMAGMDDMVSQMSEMTDAVADASSSGGPDCLLMSGHEDSDRGERDAHCPLSPAVGSGCAAVASLPATQIAAVGWAAGTSRSLGSEDGGVDLLLTHALFRPPRA
ncbi:MAG TPA: hypothetical protein VM198_14555 [Longimicrobiales bacterium]|nr:hypothetical protein [Longimicrobiales bacterium]